MCRVGLAVEAQRQFLNEVQRRRRLRRRDSLTALVRQEQIPLVDASVVGSWVLPDENHPEALTALERLKDGRGY